MKTIVLFGASSAIANAYIEHLQINTPHSSDRSVLVQKILNLAQVLSTCILTTQNKV